MQPIDAIEVNRILKDTSAPPATAPLVSIVMNAAAGHHTPSDVPLSTLITQAFEKQGCDVRLFIAEHPAQLGDLTQQALAQYRQRHGVIVAAGGDGTINTVAQRLMHQAVPLGIIPLGTFNYVARALHIPLDWHAAVQVIGQGIARPIHVGMVNQYIYLNNASIGLYPHLIEQREADKSRFGRRKIVAMASGFAVLMRQHQKMKLRVIIDGHAQPIETPMMFFGNNQLQLQDMHLKLADCAASGRLAAVAVEPVSRLQILSLIARMQLGTFEQAPEVRCFCAEHVCIETKKRQSMTLAIDGEIVRTRSPLKFQVAQHALQVMVPQHAVTPI